MEVLDLLVGFVVDPDVGNSTVYLAHDFYCSAVRFPLFAQVLRCEEAKNWRRKIMATSAKHPAFFDLAGALYRYAHKSRIDWSSEKEVRRRLIACWRIFALARVVDLQRLYWRGDWLDDTNTCMVFLWQRKNDWVWKRVLVWKQWVRDWSIPCLYSQYLQFTDDCRRALC